VSVSVCLCCGRRVKADYQFCIGCERKRFKVYSDCVGAGLSVEAAKAKVECVYPRRYSDSDAPKVSSDKCSSAKGEFYDRSGHRYLFTGQGWRRE
jgi:hypothetical protein